MEDFPLFKINSAASALSVGFALISLVIAMICIFFPRAQSISTKLLGSLMVLALAFAANSGLVYSLAIFIVATLVTDLDFLEKIAALFWNRDKYWEYRMGKATPSEVKARVANEARKEAEAENTPLEGSMTDKANAEPDSSAINSFVSTAISFEKAAQHALLSGEGPFTSKKISTNRKIISSFDTVELDAIIETSNTDFVIEIKYSKRAHALLNVLETLKRRVRAYRAYLHERGVFKLVVPVAIIPASVPAPSLFQEVMPVLKFDYVEGKFVNQKEFISVLSAIKMIDE